MGSQVGLLRSGRLVQTAAPAVLYRAPSDLDVARFVGEAVVLPGRAARGVVETALGALAVRGDAGEGPVQVVIRPEQIRVTAVDGIGATVLGRSFYGAYTALDLELADGARVVASLSGEAVPEPGAQVALFVDGPVTVFPA
jgi:iron(III) transport system ATP-binding protein